MLEAHRHFAHVEAPTAVGNNRDLSSGRVPDIEQVIYKGVRMASDDKIQPAGLWHQGDVVLIAKV